MTKKIEREGEWFDLIIWLMVFGFAIYSFHLLLGIGLDPIQSMGLISIILAIFALITGKYDHDDEIFYGRTDASWSQ